MKKTILTSLAMMALIIVVEMVVVDQVLAPEVRMFGYICAWIAGIITFLGYMDRGRKEDA